MLALGDDALAQRLDAWRAARPAAVAETAFGQRRMILAPGATIGILGGGQLGRMLAMAALKLGLRCHIYAPGEPTPRPTTRRARARSASYEDEEALARFAEAVDVVTYEFENVPIALRRVPGRAQAGASRARGRWR